MLKVGFVGCGEMGEPMAGHDVAALLYKKKAPYMGKKYSGRPISAKD